MKSTEGGCSVTLGTSISLSDEWAAILTGFEGAANVPQAREGFVMKSLLWADNPGHAIWFFSATFIKRS